MKSMVVPALGAALRAAPTVGGPWRKVLPALILVPLAAAPCPAGQGFDGIWTGQVSCEPWQDSAPFAGPVRLTIAGAGASVAGLGFDRPVAGTVRLEDDFAGRAGDLVVEATAFKAGPGSLATAVNLDFRGRIADRFGMTGTRGLTKCTVTLARDRSLEAILGDADVRLVPEKVGVGRMESLSDLLRQLLASPPESQIPPDVGGTAPPAPPPPTGDPAEVPPTRQFRAAP